MRRLWTTMLLTITVAGLALYYPCFVNDQRLERFARELSELPRPPDTVVLASSSELGNLYGTSDQCNFRVRLVLATRMSEADLRTFYEGLQVRATTPGSETAVPVVLDVFGTLRRSPMPGWPDESDRTVYMLEVFDTGPPSMDLRCG